VDTDKCESIIRRSSNVVLGKKLIISDLWNHGADMK